MYPEVILCIAIKFCTSCNDFFHDTPSIGRQDFDKTCISTKLHHELHTDFQLISHDFVVKRFQHNRRLVPATSTQLPLGKSSAYQSTGSKGTLQRKFSLAKDASGIQSNHFFYKVLNEQEFNMAEKEPMDEELDYRITFPSPAGKDYAEEEIQDEGRDKVEQPEPVVILLGWLGCQERHLAKYAAVWEQKG